MNFELESLQYWAQAALPTLFDAAAKGAVLLLAAAVVVAAMRRKSAAARQVVWLLALVSILMLPLASAALPSWQVLPSWAKVEIASPLAPSHAAAVPEGSFNGTRPSNPAVGALSANRNGPTPVTPSRPATQTPLPSPAPAAMPPAQSPWTALTPWLLMLWLSGTGACLLPLVLGRMSLWQLERKSRPVAGGPWAALARRASQTVGLRREVTLLQSSAGPVPMLWGIVQPRLLLPAEAQDWSTDRLRAVLLHEMAHAKRHDCLTKLVAHIACSAYWFNPLAWIAFRLMKREAEAACDDLVLSAGHRPSDYAQHVLEIALGLRTGVLAGCGSIAMARRSRLHGRLLAILDADRSRRALSRLSVLIAAVIVAAAAMPISIMKAAAADAGSSPGGLYEHGPSSGDDLALKVGPNTFSVRAVGRLAGAGPVRAEDGRGNPVSLEGLSWPVFPVLPDANERPDIAAFYLEPDAGRFDVIETRLFDHQTRELLNNKPGIQVSPGTDGVISVRSALAPLPSRVDLWLRANSYAQDNLPLNMPARSGETVDIGASRITLAALRADVTGVETIAHPPGRTPAGGYDIQWRKNPSGDRQDVFFVVFEQSGTWNLGRYQVCAVDKGGFKHFADSPHFIDFAEMRGPQIIVFDLPLARLDHFEWRPFGGRHRFFFDGIRLPPAGDSSASRPAAEAAQDDLLAWSNDQSVSVTALPAYDRNLASIRSFIVLSVSPLDTRHLSLGDLGLPVGSSVDRAAEKANLGDMYFVAPDRLVMLRGTAMAPVRLADPPYANATVDDRLNLMRRSELLSQFDAFVANDPSRGKGGFRVAEGQSYLVVRRDGEVFHLLVGPIKAEITAVVRYLGKADLPTSTAQPVAGPAT